MVVEEVGSAVAEEVGPAVAGTVEVVVGDADGLIVFTNTCGPRFWTS